MPVGKLSNGETFNVKSDIWTAWREESTDRLYFHNEASGATQWVDPRSETQSVSLAPLPPASNILRGPFDGRIEAENHAMDLRPDSQGVPFVLSNFRLFGAYLSLK